MATCALAAPGRMRKPLAKFRPRCSRTGHTLLGSSRGIRPLSLQSSWKSEVWDLVSSAL